MPPLFCTLTESARWLLKFLHLVDHFCNSHIAIQNVTNNCAAQYFSEHLCFSRLSISARSHKCANNLKMFIPMKECIFS